MKLHHFLELHRHSLSKQVVIRYMNNQMVIACRFNEHFKMETLRERYEELKKAEPCLSVPKKTRKKTKVNPFLGIKIM